MEATNGGILTFTYGNNVNNTGGTVLAAGGDVQVAASLTGGTILASAGTVEVQHSFIATVTGSTLTGDGQSEFLLEGGTLSGVSISPSTTVTVPVGNTGTVTDGIANNGVITISAGTSSGGLLQFQDNQTISGSGSIVLGGNPNANAAAKLGFYGSLVQPAGHTISGAGVINGTGTLTNLGLINADVAGATLSEVASTNSGTLEATNGGVLAIALNVNNQGGIVLASGGTVAIQANVTGGTLVSMASSCLSVAGATLSGVTISPNTTVTVLPGYSMSVASGITNNGTITVPSPLNSAGLNFTGQQTLAGSGTLALGSTASAPAVDVQGGTLTQAPSHSIVGTGVIASTSGYLVNQGLINADIAGGTLAVSGNNSNSGLMEASSGGIFTLGSGTVNNAGGTVLASGGTVQIGAGATVSGGTLASIGSSPIVLEASFAHGTVGMSGVTISPGACAELAQRRHGDRFQRTCKQRPDFALHEGIPGIAIQGHADDCRQRRYRAPSATNWLLPGDIGLVQRHPDTGRRSYDQRRGRR